MILYVLPYKANNILPGSVLVVLCLNEVGHTNIR